MNSMKSRLLFKHLLQHVEIQKLCFSACFDTGFLNTFLILQSYCKLLFDASNSPKL